jgi:hypothetical protein
MIIRRCLLFGVMVSCVTAAVAATAAQDRGALVRITQWDSTRLQSGPVSSDGDIDRHMLEAAYGQRRGGDRMYSRYAHQALLIRSGVPAGNGYLHQVDVGYVWHAGDLTLDVAAGVHATSNMFKHGRWHRNAVTAVFALRHELPDQKIAASVGGDYRFGRYLVYPRLHVPIALGSGSLVVDLPISAIWESGDARWRLAAVRYGDKWATLDAPRQRHSKLYLSEWRLTGTLSLPAGRQGARVEIGGGISLDSRVDYLDMSAGRRSVRLEDRVFGQLALHW